VENVILQKQLKLLLAKNQMTSSELARRTGISRQVISDWCAGVHPRNFVQVKKIAEVLGVTIDELCFGVSDVKPSEMKLPIEESILSRFEIIIKKLD
jgi:transcriptional regulator with XRE-family HTH domain